MAMVATNQVFSVFLPVASQLAAQMLRITTCVIAMTQHKYWTCSSMSVDVANLNRVGRVVVYPSSGQEVAESIQLEFGK